MLHESRPQQPQFKRQHRARHRAHREKDGHALHPHLGQLQVNLIAPFEVEVVRGRHKERHGHADRRKNDMEPQRKPHGRPSRDKIVH